MLQDLNVGHKIVKRHSIAHVASAILLEGAWQARGDLLVQQKQSIHDTVSSFEIP